MDSAGLPILLGIFGIGMIAVALLGRVFSKAPLKEEKTSAVRSEIKTVGDLEDAQWRKKLEEKEEKSVWVRFSVTQGIKLGLGVAVGFFLFWTILFIVFGLTVGPAIGSFFRSFTRPSPTTSFPGFLF